MTLTNAEIAELLALASEEHEGNKEKAARRASRKAYGWPQEAADMVEEGNSLKLLAGVGPWVARQIEDWLEDPPEVPEPPALRADFMSLSSARETLEEAPEFRTNLRGDLQMHTTYSDGRVSVKEMALEAISLGHQYVAITDHTKGLKIAGGMTEEVLAMQLREVDAFNSEMERGGSSFRILKAVEMNISPDGDGDMDPEALDELDLVLGSFHSRLRVKEDQTERYLANLRNPHVHVLGHPRCRIYNFRLGLSADWRRVFEEAAELDKAVEINSFPDRQDLNVELLELVAKAGCRVSIGTDAHTTAEMHFIEIGCAAAARAGIDPDQIINFMPYEELLEWTDSLKARV
ncbi:MAG: PHP domain-containing protein [Actinomycetota bacterium]|nr:PHP domain-containing protein [Actinomycetota bacterium]